MHKIRLLTIIAILIFVFGCDKDEEAKKTAQTNEASSKYIACLGQIVPGERIIHVAAPAGSIIGKINVKRGDQVKAGTVLATLRELKVYEAKLAHAEQAVQAAQIDLNKISKGERAELIAAQEALIQAQAEEVKMLEQREKRYKNLLKTKSASEAEYEEAIANFKMAKARLQRQKSILSSYKSGRSEEIARAEVELKLAQAKLKEVKASLDLQYIRAPQDGEMLDILVYPGESLEENGAFAYMGDTKNMMILAEVDENSITKVKLNDSALIFCKASGREFKGKVLEIQHYVEAGRIFKLDPATQSDRRTVLVRIRPENAEKLAPFCNAQVAVKILCK